MTRHPVDGCGEFDERLMDLAIEPVAEPDVEAHLATCARCRTALEQYSRTIKGISAALLTLGGPRQTAAPSGSRSSLPWTLAAAAALVAATLALATVPFVRTDLPKISVYAEVGAVVRHLGPNRVRIDQGVSTFVIHDPYSVVETPVGSLTCDSCEFTVYVDECGDMYGVPTEFCGIIGLCVMLSVSAGTVETTMANGPASVGVGQVVTWPMIAQLVDQ